MKAAAEGVQDRLTESAIELRIVATDDVGSLRADGRRVRQMLFNLLSNAIGFSAPGQTVTLAAMRRGEEIVFKVSDRGRGIPPEVLDRVFDRFESHTVGSRHRGARPRPVDRARAGRAARRPGADRFGAGEGTTVTCIFPVAGARGAVAARSPEVASARERQQRRPDLARRAAGRSGDPRLAGADRRMDRPGRSDRRFRAISAPRKTTFARALIRRLTDDPELEAPSPTFTLMQVYDAPAFPIVHADFYRIAPTRRTRRTSAGTRRSRAR